MSAIFVTATGTDIGKTFVAAGLIRHWRAAGRAVEALKPVMTGFDLAEAEGSDAGILLKALGRPVTVAEIERICPWRYAAPLSPHVATRRESRQLPFDELVAFSKHAIAANRRHAADRRGRRRHGAARRHPYGARLDDRARRAAPRRHRQLSRRAQPHADLPRRARTAQACRQSPGGQRDARFLGDARRHHDDAQALRRRCR